MSLITTSSQTVGPYLKIAFDALAIEELAPAGVSGERVSLRGRVLDGDGRPVNDGVVEIWQANAQGKYAHPEDAQDKPVEAGFRGFGRSLTRGDRGYRFATIKPGPVPGPGGRCRRRISWSRSSCAACSSISSRACTSPTNRPTRPTRC